MNGELRYSQNGNFDVEVWLVSSLGEEVQAIIPSELFTRNGFFEDDTPEEMDRGALFMANTINQMLGAQGYRSSWPALLKAAKTLCYPGPAWRRQDVSFRTEKVEDPDV